MRLQGTPAGGATRGNHLSVKQPGIGSKRWAAGRQGTAGDAGGGSVQKQAESFGATGGSVNLCRSGCGASHGWFADPE